MSLSICKKLERTSQNNHFPLPGNIFTYPDNSWNKIDLAGNVDLFVQGNLGPPNTFMEVGNIKGD